jgi:dTDP-4-amino-4,6-dideoxygalactose transaminase
MPAKNIKNAWYRFYFFLKPSIKNYNKTRYEIIKSLNKGNLKCFTGACPEIYLEKAFKNLKNFKVIRLKNCKILGETSIALDVNHTLNDNDHKQNLLTIESVLKKNLKNK